MTSAQLLNSIINTQAPCPSEILARWNDLSDWTTRHMPCLDGPLAGLELKGRRYIGRKGKEDFQI